ncbi:BgTH12-03242 [Blumeria graminis f. sp. triticale]|uniref:BgtA-20386 n=3 Tax=Blumeria graminis TaxID=34373 RepID=A0A9X9MJE8_BLUGR|nr:hypothetical protein BGT96224_A20386 [Blumeria graminis f. sp. tritici 96224]CAD6503582.1 BgTH12-03242 [Blumeria graminis f. sp. triticale]VDB89726.1 BgtA-20386 [Blumeria graminis f. sp. tritici]
MSAQRKFELIPTTLAGPIAYKPPMTSKQVKKAYQQANRSRKITRIEQRKLEAQEFARQRKEYEQEKASARAKTTRDRKAAKTLVEREARRKVQLPDSRRSLRASQPSISMYVRNNPSVQRGWQMEKESSEDSETITDVHFNQTEEMIESITGPKISQYTADLDSENEFGDFPSFSQLEIFDSPINQQNKTPCLSLAFDDKNAGKVEKQAFGSSQREKVTLVSPKPQFQLSEQCVDLNSQLEDRGCALVSKKTLMEANLNACEQNEFTFERLSTPKTTLCPVDQHRYDVHNKIVATRSQLSLEDQHINLADNLYTEHAETRLFDSSPSKIPLSSTQVFLEDHLEDFFPSPTQEVRELEIIEDTEEYVFPSNSQIMTEICKPDDLGEVDLTLKTLIPLQSLKSYNEEEKSNEKDYPKYSGCIAQSPEVDVARTIEDNDFLDDQICTQDFLILSQQIRSGKPSISIPEAGQAQPDVNRGSKGRFFEEKEEDLLQAALYESKVMNTEGLNILKNLDTLSKESMTIQNQQISPKLLPISFFENTGSISLLQPEEPKSTKISLNNNPDESQTSLIPSQITDYGADELESEDWEELYNLC